MEINAFDFCGNESTHVIPDEFDYLHVAVVSGDEVINVIKVGKNKLPNLVACIDGLQDGSRCEGHLEGQYYVVKSDIERWKTRKSQDDGYRFAIKEEDA